MDNTIADLLRIRRLRENRAQRSLLEARAVLAAAQAAVVRARSESDRFGATLPQRIEQAYSQLQQEADAKKGVLLHQVRAFRDFETHMHKQQAALRLVVVEKQKAAQSAAQQVEERVQQLHAVQRACLKLEILSKQQAQERRVEQERAEDKALEEFKPRSIFAQMV